MTKPIRHSVSLFALLLAALAFGAAAPAPAVAAEHRLGVGVHYWRTLDDLADEGFDELDENGTSGVLSYQYIPGGSLSLQIDGEYFAKGFGGSTEATFSPQVFLVLGVKGPYAAAGIGVLYSDELEDEISDPFYIARLGWNLELVPNLYIDLNANYQAGAWSELDQADTDTVTLGGVVRFGF